MSTRDLVILAGLWFVFLRKTSPASTEIPLGPTAEGLKVPETPITDSSGRSIYLAGY